ncbi:tetratricopeptide repeat protein [Uliginosibacterium sediminicola]|uniref:Tetratricopeptide repeat protein n=1 Tax=Uliginosibacterium sediminicola TaxID=2024550 RepID=A0ABU9YUS3_9RHOO
MTSAQIAARKLFEESSALLVAREFAAAATRLRQAILLWPEFAEAHANLGFALEQLGERCAAEEAYITSLRWQPQQAQTHLNLGALLAEQMRHDEAEACYRRALQIDARNAVAWSNLGVLLACLRRDAEAEQCYRQALQLQPDYATAHFNFAYLLLRAGRYEEGWAHFEWRDWYAQLDALLASPRWRGESLQGKRVLIGIEAGHGDMIQFCRYARSLKALGATRVSILCHPALQRLFSQAADIDVVLPLDAALPTPDWDVWVPALSLPYYCQSRLDNLPAELPYLHADADDIAERARQISALTGSADLPVGLRVGLRVGLVWRGNPRFENDAQRSLPSLDSLRTLIELPGINFFSLQKGAGEDEVAKAPRGTWIHDLAPSIQDFADTAAIIMNLDLLICVDTAVAHLAASLGKPCWVLLPDYKTDWRWLNQRSDSPWYPEVIKLFRQQKAGEWDSVITAVRLALLEQLAATTR